MVHDASLMHPTNDNLSIKHIRLTSSWYLDRAEGARYQGRINAQKKGIPALNENANKIQSIKLLRLDLRLEEYNL